jgi:hypothetical protein
MLTNPGDYAPQSLDDRQRDLESDEGMSSGLLFVGGHAHTGAGPVTTPPHNATKFFQRHPGVGAGRAPLSA